MKQFDTIRAAFRPCNVDDLRDGSEALIGRVCDWQCAWIIEEGPYQGQAAMVTLDTERWPFAWVPLCDLDPVTCSART